jgi:hypothetical protein
MGNSPESPIPALVFRNCSAVVAKFRVERLSSVGVWLVNPSKLNPGSPGNFGSPLNLPHCVISSLTCPLSTWRNAFPLHTTVGREISMKQTLLGVYQTIEHHDQTPCSIFSSHLTCDAFFNRQQFPSGPGQFLKATNEARAGGLPVLIAQ